MTARFHVIDRFGCVRHACNWRSEAVRYLAQHVRAEDRAAWHIEGAQS